MPRDLGNLHVSGFSAGVDLQLPVILLLLSATVMVIFTCSFWRRKPPKMPKTYTFNDSVVGGSGGMTLGLGVAANPVVASSQASEKKENETSQS